MDVGGGARDALVGAGRAELAENGRTAVSLRAVARRAGVSHAAPAYHFGDRAGLLTAIAASGFREMAAAMDAPLPEGLSPLAVLGERYVAFAEANPALYELMFRPAELKAEDSELRQASAASLEALIAATASSDGAPSELALVSWAFAHGVAALASQGALGAVPLSDGVADPVSLIRRFADAIGRA